MKKIIFTSLIIGTLIAATFSCERNGSGNYIRLTPGGQAFKAIDGALGGAEGLISGSVNTSSFSSDVTTSASGLAAKWEVASSYNNPKYNPSECPGTTETTSITLKQYMGTQFESNQKRCNGSAINIFGRLDNAAGIVCIMMNRLNATTSAEMASAADLTFTMDAATKAELSLKCPTMAADLNNESSVPTGTPVTIQLDSPAVTTTYDLKVTIQPFNNTVFLKYGGDEISFANNEDNSTGNQRVLVNYNKITKVLRAEYVSKSKFSTDAPLYIHRLYMDELNQQGRIISTISSGYTSQDDAIPDRTETYIVSGYPSSSTIALSISMLGMGMGISDGTHEACVNGDNGNITNDTPVVSSDSFDCGTPESQSKAIGFSTASATINSETDGATPTTWWVLATGSEVLNWSTRDNMLTQGL
jgi:hypothetical protein